MRFEGLWTPAVGKRPDHGARPRHIQVLRLPHGRVQAFCFFPCKTELCGISHLAQGLAHSKVWQVVTTDTTAGGPPKSVSAGRWLSVFTHRHLLGKCCPFDSRCDMCSSVIRKFGRSISATESFFPTVLNLILTLSRETIRGDQLFPKRLELMSAS